ncbi:MAG: ribbon-helix-helix protein, CopG family [Bdellovibrionaceae bacterium]|jgi:predicted DNA-binding protein|nr:ribbon-helix-helix protein, CopG family [Pseudobdellovibrionaceae bacterium]
MPTKNPRLNVVVNDEIYKIIEKLATREGKSMSVVAKELLEDAIDKHEDLLLSELAQNREKTSKKAVPHDKAWD